MTPSEPVIDSMYFFQVYPGIKNIDDCIHTAVGAG